MVGFSVFVIKKAGQAKDFTVASWNAAETRAEIDEHYKRIGELVFKAHTTEADTGEEIEAHVAALEELLEKLNTTEEERRNIYNRKRCPQCNKPIAKSNAFCPHCGASVK